jgi:hypothetical protein
MRVFRALLPAGDLTLNSHGVFLPQCGGGFIDCRVGLGIKDHLHDSSDIPEVDEKEVPVVTDSIHPPHEMDVLSVKGGVQFSAVFPFFPVHASVPVTPHLKGLVRFYILKIFLFTMKNMKDRK